jgi:hypothetical protein
VAFGGARPRALMRRAGYATLASRVLPGFRVQPGQRPPMAIFLDEDMAGRDPALIGFPHLLVCMGLLVKGDTALYGVHITGIEQTNPTVNGFAVYLGQQGVTAANMEALYASANFKIRYAGVSSRNTKLTELWSVEMRRIAGKLGYKGPIYGFDTSIIAPRDGTYVEYHATPTIGKCRIFYKRNEKLQYTSAVQIPGIVKIKNEVPQPYPGVVKTSATIQLGSNLTEVDYANRLVTEIVI